MRLYTYVDLFVSCGKLTTKFKEIYEAKGWEAGQAFLERCVKRKQLTQANLERIKGYVSTGRADVVLQSKDVVEAQEQQKPSS